MYKCLCVLIAGLYGYQRALKSPFEQILQAKNMHYILGGLNKELSLLSLFSSLFNDLGKNHHLSGGGNSLRLGVVGFFLKASIGG